MPLLSTSRTESFTPISAKAFRRQVLRPVDGVFMFHPRALERLVRQHQDQGLLSRHVPALSYYLIPREVFLIALEDENPEALSVIEGIDLPAWVILLPTPLPSRRITTPPRRLLYHYWASRFEAEVARNWQQHRDDQQDQERFGPEGLQTLIGRPAMLEIREVLERERRIMLDQDETSVVRHFVALIIRQRFFTPSLRTLWFPAIRDWPLLDQWIADSGLALAMDEQSNDQQQAMPPLLRLSRPQQLHIGLQPGPELPLRLPYPCNDANTPCSAPCPPQVRNKPTQTPEIAPAAPISALQRFCLNALDRPLAGLRARGLSGTLTNWAGRIVGRLLYRQQPCRQSAKQEAPSTLQRRIRAAAFHRLLSAGKRAEANGHLARAIRRVIEASWQYQHLAFDWLKPDDPVLARLDARLQRLSSALADGSRRAWDADVEQRNILLELAHTLCTEQLGSGRIRPGNRLMHQLEQATTAARTNYLGVHWLGWLRSRGRQPLRQPLPYQGRLKALRALDSAVGELDALPWQSTQVEYFRPTLNAARDTLSTQLTEQIRPRLDAALKTADMQPHDHRQTVAQAKLRAELRDVVGKRYHLRFSDVRDAVARNDLPLQDLKPYELIGNDRLGRLDRQLAKQLPGLYRRGEFYLKVLHRLSSWLFGTSPGRLATRYALLPFGAALVTLVIVDHITPLFSSAEPHLALTNPWSILALGILLNGLFHTRIGRETMASVWRGISVAFTLVVFHGLRNLLSWEPIARLLRNATVRELSRYLVEPMAIGLLTAVPAAALVLWLLPQDHSMPWEVFALGFVLGSFLRNTQRGRRILDAGTAYLAQFWMRVRHTLVSGLFRLVVDLFKSLLDAFEQMLYRLEELARYRAGESTTRALAKSALRPIGASLAYVARFYITVLVEPQVNPIKHFPVVTVSHKMILPALPAITTGMLTVLDPLIPRVVSLPFVTATVLLLPGFFGFLVWELKENWKLFEANRPKRIRPVLVGHHGETLRVMLRRGFHAGTVPKAFDRLRKLLSDARDSGISPRVKLRKAEANLLHSCTEIIHLRDRELLTSLQQHRIAGRLPSLDRIAADRDYLATESIQMSLQLHLRDGPALPPADSSPQDADRRNPRWTFPLPNPHPEREKGREGTLIITLYFSVVDGELRASSVLSGPFGQLTEHERQLIDKELADFFARCAAIQGR